MTDPIPTLLSRLKALHEKATPGDWTNGGIFNPNTPEASANIWGETPAGFASGECIAEKVLLANAIYIANIHNVLPQLLAHIEAQDKRVSAMVEALEAARAGLHSVCVFEAEERIDESDLGEIEIHHNTECKAASAALAAWRKNHG